MDESSPFRINGPVAQAFIALVQETEKITQGKLITEGMSRAGFKSSYPSDQRAKDLLSRLACEGAIECLGKVGHSIFYQRPTNGSGPSTISPPDSPSKERSPEGKQKKIQSSGEGDSLSSWLGLLLEQAVLTNNALAALNAHLRTLEVAQSRMAATMTEHFARMESGMEKMQQSAEYLTHADKQLCVVKEQLGALQARVAEREAIFEQLQKSQQAIRNWLAREPEDEKE